MGSINVKLKIMRNLRIHYFQHVPYETLGCIRDWAKEYGHHVTCTQFFDEYSLPRLEDIDWLIVLGGPMGIYEEDKYPWLVDEKNFIKRAIDNQKVVIGICLGAQIIAELLGSRVYPNKEKEIGFFPVYFSQEAETNDIFRLIPKEVEVFHWHGDTFDLPEGAIHLAKSEACKNQAFIYGNRIVGLQFHFEITREIIDDLINYNRYEIVDSRFVQSITEIRSNMFMTIELNVFMKCILERLEQFSLQPVSE